MEGAGWSSARPGEDQSQGRGSDLQQPCSGVEMSPHWGRLHHLGVALTNAESWPPVPRMFQRDTEGTRAAPRGPGWNLSGPPQVPAWAEAGAAGISELCQVLRWRPHLIRQAGVGRRALLGLRKCRVFPLHACGAWGSGEGWGLARLDPKTMRGVVQNPSGKMGACWARLSFQHWGG